MKSAIYPGTFDPITSGHLDVLRRGCHIFDRVIIAVAEPVSDKQPLFSLQERLQMIAENLTAYPQAAAKPLSTLTVDFAHANNAVAIIRGLRAVSDFDYEFQMAQINRNLATDIETIFLMPSEKYFFLSSGLIKEISQYTDNIKAFVPPNVHKALTQRYKTGRHHNRP